MSAKHRNLTLNINVPIEMQNDEICQRVDNALKQSQLEQEVAMLRLQAEKSELEARIEKGRADKKVQENRLNQLNKPRTERDQEERPKKDAKKQQKESEGRFSNRIKGLEKVA